MCRRFTCWQLKTMHSSSTGSSISCMADLFHNLIYDALSRVEGLQHLMWMVRKSAMCLPTRSSALVIRVVQFIHTPTPGLHGH